MKIITKKFLCCLTIILLSLNVVLPQSVKKGERNTLKSVAINPSSTRININNISDYVYNNGDMDMTPEGEQGLFYPKGSGKGLFFESGLLWGGNIDSVWSVGGSALFRHGIVPGRILPDGTAENPNMASVRIYRVRSDYKNFSDNAGMKLLYAGEIADEGKTAEEIFAQYDLDWKEWPAQYGAPYIDKDNDGVYNPNIDVPGISEEPCQTTWYVANDLDATATKYLYGGLPMKLEMQATFFAFKTTGPMGNTIFKKYKLINKNSKKIEHMYFSMWSDPDLGSGYDDLVGCDTTLNLGYVYNSTNTDAIYGSNMPAAGFTLLQGPVVSSAGDSAKIFGKWKRGYKNLGLSTFTYFWGGTTMDYADPTSGNYSTGALSWKNIFEGKLSRSGNPFIDPTKNNATKFIFNGDPITGRGWIDPIGGDKRMACTAGPFTMNPGDTQEVVFAQIAAGGTTGIDRLTSLRLLKANTYMVNFEYNYAMCMIETPKPIVRASGLDNSIILDWSDPASYSAAESFNKFGYKFEGYNVYQLPSATAPLSSGIRIATYDLMNGVTTIVTPVIDELLGVVTYKIAAYGTDSGIYRYIKITDDKIKGIPALYNGSAYYFAVTSYAYNSSLADISNFMESSPQIISVTPQSTTPGKRYASSIGDTLSISHSAGLSEGRVLAKIIDPSKGDGAEYTVSFNDITHYNIQKGAAVLYTNKLIAGVASDNPIIAGTQVHVVPLPGEGLKNTEMTHGTNPWDVTDQNMTLPTFNITKYKGLWNDGIQMGCNWYYKGATSAQLGNGSSLTIDQYHDVILKFADTDANGVFNENDANASMAYRYMIYANRAAVKPEFAPFIKNKLSYGFQEFGLNGKANIPIAAFDQSTGKRLNIAFVEDNSTSGMVDGKYFPPKPNFNYSNRANEIFLILGSEYSTTINPAYSQPDREIYLNTKYGPLPIMYFIQSGRAKDAFSSADELLIEAYKLYSSADQYKFVIPAVTTSTELAKEDINKINVFPNPYYGLDPNALSSSEAKVTFTHLPQTATIKIFNISGQLVRTIDKNEPGQYLVWDLKTDGGTFVSSGIFIAHVEMPDLGKIKILKIAVIQGQRYLVGF